MTTTVDPFHDYAIIPQVGNSTFVGLIALLVAVPASVYAARRTVPDGWRRRVMGAGEGILVLFTIGMGLSAIGGQNDYADTASGVSYEQPSPQAGLVDDGKPISNLYVYDQNGKLLDGVLVYDQDGQRVSASPFTDRSVLDNDGWLDGNGALVTNIYPKQMLQAQWSDNDGANHYVAVPPPAVAIPQGLHRVAALNDPQQGSATGPTAPTSTLTPTLTTTPTSTSTPASTATPTASSSAAPPASSSTTPTSTPPTSTPSISTPGGASGAHSSSALPSTPAPPGATH